MPKVITVPALDERWDAENEIFLDPLPPVKFTIEHSLISISKWEQKWNKSFIMTKEKTPEEMADYIRCMTMTPNIDPEVYKRIPLSVIQEIKEYMEAPMTSVKFLKEPKRAGGRKYMANEDIYQQMFALHIPIECEKWHLNRLLTLIQVCATENDPNPKKMPITELARRNSQLNAARRKALNSKG